ncbi:MAG: tRNA (adenosine(37)-N6)-threonylcarbamoyltransferase complex dimerization subunit type 1 TsaB [Bacteroidetes bacterium]|nr:tRNA (adenosine(37)-N6)-threonylcarbamoyltransferase complex dimerization subunit type 1 TsaB [Bacteroidota bacterium]MDA1119182.1 tRNA (adenosine(37)-N6)-threonylcarbamoyltransferase complex dimerization subunit type 1 TsaB [Bacteroidota bacterium]
MAFLLSIETSTEVCSVALHEDSNLIAFTQYLLEKSHSSILTSLIDEMIKHSGIKLNDINAVAVSEGPGSYTGLRIGTSTAKGLCFGLDIPLINISTLLSMAYGISNLNPNKAYLCPMLDARRMEVYCLIADSGLKIIREIKPEIIEENSFEDILKKNEVFFFGNGAAKCKDILGHNPNAQFYNNIHPNAKDIGGLAWLRYQKREFADLTYFEPFYLKAFKPGKPKTLV